MSIHDTTSAPSKAEWLNKVPEVTFAFWLVKVLSTTHVERVGRSGAERSTVPRGVLGSVRHRRARRVGGRGLPGTERAGRFRHHRGRWSHLDGGRGACGFSEAGSSSVEPKLARSVEAPRYVRPVEDVPAGTEELRFPVLVLQVVGVFPRIEHQ